MNSRSTFHCHNHGSPIHAMFLLSHLDNFREEPGAGKPHARICEGESLMAELLDQSLKNSFTADELLAHLVDAEWDERYNRILARLRASDISRPSNRSTSS